MSEKLTKSLDSKLMKYTAAVAAVGGVSGATGQIVYTDVDPDLTFTGHSVGVALDIDQDGTDDFVVATLDTAGIMGSLSGGTSYSITYAGAVLQASGSNSWLGVNTATGTTSSSIVVANLTSGAPINSSATIWSGGQGYLDLQASFTFPAYPGYGGTFGGGVWAGVTDGYAGLKFASGTKTLYGWVRMDVSSDGKTVTIKDFAYNAVDGGSINAGQMPTSVNELDNQIEVIGAVDQIIINNNSGSNGTVTVMNMSGQVVANEAVSGTKEVMDASTLSTGVYMVQVTVNDQTTTKKIYLR